MLGPADIQNKQFTRGVRGYREDEVDVFLDMLTLDFEKLIKENAKLHDEIAALETEIAGYKESENSVTKTMEQARALMDDLAKSAERRADAIVTNAELDAQIKVREAKEHAARIEEENKNIRNRYIEFRDKYRNMLEQELSRFELISEDMFPDFSENRLEEILAEDDDAKNDAQAAPVSGDTVVMKEIDVENMARAMEDDDRRTIVMSTDEIFG